MCIRDSNIAGGLRNFILDLLVIDVEVEGVFIGRPKSDATLVEIRDDLIVARVRERKLGEIGILITIVLSWVLKFITRLVSTDDSDMYILAMLNEKAG